jgi:molybdopterin-synthase adenylyltransferase
MKMKPFFKNTHTTIIEKDDKLYLHLESDSLEIEDPDRSFKNLLKELNGDQTIKEISDKTQLRKEVLLDLINDLDTYGLIEDNTHSSQTTLSPGEQERYKSHFNFFSSFSNLINSRFLYQEKLRDSKVSVLGLGGSSIILSNLAGMGIGSILGLDFDKIELSNLNRQFLFSEKNIGEQKTKVTKEKIMESNSDINIDVIDLKVTNSRELLPHILDSSIVINTIDQPSIQSTRWVNFACVRNNIPLIQGGTGLNKLLIQAFFPHESACFDCYLIQILRENPEFEDELRQTYGSKMEGRNTAFAPNVAFLAGLITSQTSNIICNFIDSPNISYTTEYATISLEKVATRKWSLVEDCPTFGNHLKTSEPVDLNHLISIAKDKVVI